MFGTLKNVCVNIVACVLFSVVCVFGTQRDRAVLFAHTYCSIGLFMMSIDSVLFVSSFICLCVYLHCLFVCVCVGVVICLFLCLFVSFICVCSLACLLSNFCCFVLACLFVRIYTICLL